MFESIKRRLAEILDAPGEIARASAPKVAAKLRKDATTKRGNVPSFGRMGDVPIRAEVRAGAGAGFEIDVNGPDWVIEKAKEKGQTAEWGAIVQDEAARILGGEK